MHEKLCNCCATFGRVFKKQNCGTRGGEPCSRSNSTLALVIFSLLCPQPPLMEQPPVPPKPPSSKSVLDLETDALAHCANYLSLRDVSNFAMTCKFFKSVAYSDSVWRHFFRKQWPQLESSSFSRTSCARDVYLDRYMAVQQFKLQEDVIKHQWSFHGSGTSWRVLLDKDDIFLTLGSVIVKINYWSDGSHSVVYMRDHNARITCMRLFSASKTSLFRNEAGHKDNFLVTSSCDHCIRLWWKGHCYRTFRGHNGPVTALSDKLLGEGSSSSGNLIASGGEDGTVRLWSLTSNSKQRQRALRTTFYGHGRAIESLSVSGYKTSLLVSISRDAKIKVWDTAASSSASSSCCVGMSSVRGPPLGVKCFESLCYVAAGTSITAIDLRTMQKVFSAAACQPLFYSFEVLPSKFVVCTGGYEKAMLWDVRRSGVNPEPVIELEGHSGPVSSLHMDSYKVVTGSPNDSYCNVWDTSSGTLVNSLPVGIPYEPDLRIGCSALAVSGSRIVTTTCGEVSGLVYLRDFINATCPKPSNEDGHRTSKFWEPQGISDAFDN